MEKFWEYLEDEDRLVAPTTLILGIAAILGIVVATDGVVKELITSSVPWRIVLYCTPIIAWVSYWLYKKYKLPQNTDEYIGIVVCIQTESNQEKIRLKEDFITRLNELIQQNGLQDTVQTILLKNYQAKRVASVFTDFQKHHPLHAQDSKKARKAIKKWSKVQEKLLGHFYIWGNIKRRQHTENTYFLQTAALVIHSPFEPKSQRALSQEINQIWTKLIQFQERDEFMGFQFSADLTFVAAKYIIGIAAFMSADAATALRLHGNLEAELKNLRPLPRGMQTVRERLKRLLAVEHYFIAQILIRDGGKTEDIQQHLTKSLELNPISANTYNLQAIFEFDYEHNPVKALNTIRRGKPYMGQDGTLNYSEAFLLMYLDRFDRGIRQYRRICEHRYPNERAILDSVFKFNEKVLINEPDKVQCHYIIAFLKYKKEENLPEALEHFELFLEKARGDRHFRELVSEAEAYKSDIERDMQLRADG